MDSSAQDEVNFTSLVELFGTFFEKVTNFHPQKDTLSKQLYGFKQMLYTNKADLNVVDDYLNDLRKKTQSSVLIDLKPINGEKYQAAQPKGVSPKYHSKTTKNFKTFDTEIVKLGLKPQKFDLYTVAEFIKTRSLEQSNQKQSLLSKYSHVREFELDSSNFYRLIAIGTITHLIYDPSSQPKFSDIIDDVISRRIVLKNYYYSYSHDEYANVFCGYLEQLVHAKNAGQTLDKVLELFHDMIKYDHLFNIALLCYLKGKLINFLTDKLPKNFEDNQIAWDQLQSPDVAEKILNNNPIVIESLLGLLPYLLNLRIVTQVTENGTLYERIYSKNLMSTLGQHFIMRSSENSGPAIHLLVEKIFTTSNYYLLLPIEGKPISNSLETAHANNNIISGINTSYAGQKIQIESSPSHQDTDVKELAIEVLDSPARKIIHNSTTNSFYRPKIGYDKFKYIAESPSGSDSLKRRDLSAPRPSSNFRKSPRYFLTPSRLRPSNLNLEPSKEITRSEKKRPATATEFSEIVNASICARLNKSSEKENNGTTSNSLLRSPYAGNNELKDRSQSVNTPGSRTPVPKNPILQLFSMDNTPISNSKQAEKKQTGEFSRQAEISNAIVISENAKPVQIESESPYDAYIKTRVQSSVIDQSSYTSSLASTISHSNETTIHPSVTPVQLTSNPFQTSGATSQSPITSQAKDKTHTKTSSFGYSGMALNSTPYDNYVSSYNRSYLNNTIKGPDRTGSTTPYNLPTTNLPTENFKVMTSSASTTTLPTTSTTPGPTTKFTPTGYYTTSSPSKNIFKGSNNSQNGYPNLGNFSSSNSSTTSDIDQMLRDRFKNMFTLAPRTNEALPLNPFSQTTKYSSNTPVPSTKDTQDTTPSNSYSYSNKYNLDSYKIPKYGTSYSQQDKNLTSGTLKEVQSAKTLQTLTNTQKIASNVTQTNLSNRNSVNDPGAVNGSFTTNSITH